jgi:hypothetical protein
MDDRQKKIAAIIVVALIVVLGTSWYVVSRPHPSEAEKVILRASDLGGTWGETDFSTPPVLIPNQTSLAHIIIANTSGNIEDYMFVIEVSDFKTVMDCHYRYLRDISSVQITGNSSTIQLGDEAIVYKENPGTYAIIFTRGPFYCWVVGVPESNLIYSTYNQTLHMASIQLEKIDRHLGG